MMAVVFYVDATTAMGVPPVPNDEIAEELRMPTPTCSSPSAASTPTWAGRGPRGTPPGRRAAGASFKFHPTVQAFHPSDRMAYPVYEAIAEHGLIALFHTGQTGIGKGCRRRRPAPEVLQPAGRRRRGRRLPRHAHRAGAPVVPVAGRGARRRHPQGAGSHRPVGVVAPVLPPQLVQYANTLLADKVLFGSDFPMITPDRWLADFETLDIKPEVRPKILKHNAARLLEVTEE